MHFQRLETSCGVFELGDLQGQSPESSLAFMKSRSTVGVNSCECGGAGCEDCEEKGEGMFAHVIFTDLATGSPGAALARYLNRKWRGSVKASAVKVNPNTDSRLVVWVFSPPQAYFDWCDA